VNNGRIENSYSKISIAANASVGNFVGENSGTIESSYALRRVTEERFAVDDYGAICENSGLKSADEMKQQNTFIGWDFIHIWEIAPDINDGFPYLYLR
jgi:hypothetical protein